MNEYGQRLYDYFSRHDPESVVSLRNPERYFTSLGRAVAAEIATIMDRAVNERRLDETRSDFRARVLEMQRETESMVLTRTIAAGLGREFSGDDGVHDSVPNFRDHLGRLATYFSEGGLGL